MASRARGDVLQSPYIAEFADFADKLIRITVNFNNTTRVISGATVFRDVDCRFTRILVGLGADGRPDTTSRSFNVPAGSTAIQKAVFTNQGFSTIEQFQALQITAAPPA
jgi:hypothetical protein